MAGDLRIEQIESGRVHGPVFSNPQFQDLWNLAEIRALNLREQARVAQLPADFYSPGGAASVSGHDVGVFPPSQDQARLTQSVLPSGDELLRDLQLARNSESDTYRRSRQGALETDIVRITAPKSDRILFPYRGTEDRRLAECSKGNPKAWNDAFDSFPGLKEHLAEGDGARLMQAIVRNELNFFDAKDALGDREAKAGKADWTETLGYAQITPKGVAEFEKAYPQLRSFLESKGYAGFGHEAKALEDPRCVPMIVAAKLQSLTDLYSHHADRFTGAESISVTARTLAYGYNADVYYDPKDAENPKLHPNPLPSAVAMEKLAGFVKAFPTADERVLAQSMHLAHVEEQLKILANGPS